MKIIPAYPKTEKNGFKLTADNTRHHWSDYTIPQTFNEFRTVSLDGAAVVKRGIILPTEHKATVYTAFRQAETEKQLQPLTVKQAAEIVKTVRRQRLALPAVSVMACTYANDQAKIEEQRRAEQQKRKKEVLDRLTEKKYTTTAEQAEKAKQHSEWIGKVGQCKDDLTKVEYTWKALADIPTMTHPASVKVLQKDAAAALHTMHANATAKKAHEVRFSKEVKRCTIASKAEKYAADFKAAFTDIVTAEYTEKKAYTKDRKKALSEKLDKVKAEILELQKAIKALDSIQAQFKKDTPNFDLITRRLTDIQTTQDIDTPAAAAAVKTYYSDKLRRAMYEYEYTAGSLDEIKDGKKLYSRMFNGNEILVQVTTRFLVNNVCFSVPVGYICNNDNSTHAIRRVYELSAAALEKMEIKDYYLTVNYNIFENSDTLLPLARQLVKRQSVNMIQRQGSKTQYSIYYACMRNDFADHDTADLYSVCYSTLTTALSVKNPAAVSVNIKILERLNFLIKNLNPAIDCEKIEKITAAANRAIKKYRCIYPAAADYNCNKRTITMLENIHAAAVTNDITALKTACYNAMNDYLTNIRAIRDSDKVTLNLDDYIDRLITAIDIDDLNAVKKHALQLAYTEMKKRLTKSTLKTFDYMLRGYTVTQIAEKREIDKSTTSKHVNEIRAAFCTAYTDLLNAGKIDNAAHIILFDPSVFAAVKTISEKYKKVVDTYTKNTEIEKISAAVAADAVNAACMKYEFKKFIKGLKKYELKVLSLLLDSNSIREAAAAADIGKSSVLRIKAKILDTFYSIIELNTNISIDRNALVKVDFNTLVSMLID